MSVSTKLGRDLFRGVAIACVLALVVALVLWWLLSGSSSKKITAYFTEAVGVYPGSTVRVHGVAVGTIDGVQSGVQPPDHRSGEPPAVQVTMSVDRDINVPANTHAVIIAPSVVSDRYVELDPYTGGPKMADNGVIGLYYDSAGKLPRTQGPAELDDLYRSVNTIATALGPNGANRNGELSDLLNTLANNLSGNGQNLHNTIAQLGQAAGTLNNNQKDLFTTVDYLAKFATALQQSDGQLRQFDQRLADVSGFLDNERTSLASTVKVLANALDQVQSFIAKNRSALKSNVDNLTQVTKVLVDERSALAETLDVAPTALNNLANAYNANSGAIDARPNLNELSDPPIVMICKLVQRVTPSQLPSALASTCSSLASVLSGALPLPSVGSVIQSLENGQLPQLPAQAAQTTYGGGQ